MTHFMKLKPKIKTPKLSQEAKSSLKSRSKPKLKIKLKSGKENYKIIGGKMLVL